ncbi:inner nuclear membrane protein Man1-like [Eurosta solidaginis]|uniref:inner nuclear membrane protein Man1-like n=1 Tax=Eurosta solidaginis TaxID=178769 RepID=UPI00353168F5
MSLEYFDDLTDVELRHELLEYGFPNVPITETSRGCLVKKLKNHMKNLKSRKQSTKPYVTECFKEEQENLVAQDKDWSQHSAGNHQKDGATRALVNLEESVAADIDTPRVHQLNHTATGPLRERSRKQRTQETNQQLSNLTDNSSRGFFSTIWKIMGLEENCTNSVWWCLTLFFLALTFMYMINMTDLTKNINEENAHYVICDRRNPAGPLLRSPFVCIDKERLEPTLTTVRYLIEKLRIRTKRHYCYDRTKPKAMSVMEFIMTMFEDGIRVDMRNIREAQYLITCNPQWKIDIVDSKKNPVIFIGLDKIVPYQNTFFVLKKPRLPLPCLLYNKGYRFIHFVSNVALIMSVIMLIVLFYCYVRRRQEQHLATVQSYIDKIIEELRQRARNSENLAGREVVVNHLRDHLIPVSDRKRELTYWNEALNEVEEQESRVRFDVTIRDGEKFRTMRWADSSEKLLAEKSMEIETNC